MSLGTDNNIFHAAQLEHYILSILSRLPTETPKVDYASVTHLIFCGYFASVSTSALD